MPSLQFALDVCIYSRGTGRFSVVGVYCRWVVVVCHSEFSAKGAVFLYLFLGYTRPVYSWEGRLFFKGSRMSLRFF